MAGFSLPGKRAPQIFLEVAASAAAAASLPDILKVEAVDGVSIVPKEDGMLAPAEKAAHDSGKIMLGSTVNGSSSQSPQSMFALGYTLVCGATDMGLLQGAAKHRVSQAFR